MTTTTETPVKKYDEQQRFEFLLYINNHIICQRYFNIRDYNEDVINSYDIKDLMDRIVGTDTDGFGGMGIIPKHLKDKSVDYLWGNFNPYDPKIEEGAKNIFEKIDNFQFEIKVDKNSVGKAQFSGNNFPPKVRYAVDIKEIIPSIMAEIRHSFSQKNYDKVEASEAL
jgi:hypothetical protein